MDTYVEFASPADAAGIANVHINSWREAYRGLLPQEFLEDQPLRFHQRHLWWQKVIEENKTPPVIVRAVEHGVVGFIHSGEARNSQYRDLGEVYCIYLLKKYQNRGLGFAMLKRSFEVLKDNGYSAAYLWVLKDNPTIDFYRKTGAVFSGDEIEAQVAGIPVVEQRFVWDPLMTWEE